MSEAVEFDLRMAAIRAERDAREAAKTLPERAEDMLKEAQRILTNCPHSLDVECAKALIALAAEMRLAAAVKP